jgi:hypothetical protein
VGNAGGYWGDDPDALYRQLTQGDLDYITVDFLAEVTMSILQKHRSRKQELGYATDFLEQMRQCLPVIGEKGTRIITNAGGVNPRSCAEALSKLAHEKGFAASIAVVEGDDLLDRLEALQERGISFRNMETDQEFHTISSRVQSANAYLGAASIIRALQEGARIIVTGRVADASLTVAAPFFEFGWDFEDWDRLATTVAAGHILECGAQASGGNLTDWETVPSFLNMGYPIAKFFADGSFLITKHPDSGGVINRQTVTSQLIYEIGDPRQYITPDITADFSTLRLEDEGNDCVRVSGVKGANRSNQLKVSISYLDGYKAHGALIVSGPRAADKCRLVADSLWKRLALEFQETRTELVGHSACHGQLAPKVDPPEILLRLGVKDSSREKVVAFSQQFTSLILNTVPGVGIVGARPRVQEVIAYWPCLIPASEINTTVTLLEKDRSFQVPWAPPKEKTATFSSPPALAATTSLRSSSGHLATMPLRKLCYGRSGDKGDTCNIGLVARSQEIYHWMFRELTTERIKDYFAEICQGEVQRFELPNLLAFNFLLHRALGGGGTVSLRVDPQGKTLAEALLMMPIEAPEDLVETADRLSS